MAVHFHSLKIKKIRKETDDCVSVSFEVPPDIQEDFNFREGQNVTLRKKLGGEELRRSYSICSAPYERELKIAIKKVEGGMFSSFANDTLKPGDFLEVMPPTGKFNARVNKKPAGNFLAIAAGSGITPILSIIKHTLFSDPLSRFTLIYANRNRASIIFFDELEGLKNSFIDRFNFINILSREKTESTINYGRIDENKLEALRKILKFTQFDDIFLCGPEELVVTAESFLLKEGLVRDAIHFELFTTPGQTTRNMHNTAQLDEGPRSNISIKVDGRSFAFALAFNGMSILDAALNQGADLPFACKGGVCCTCRAKLVEGEVRMDVNYALEPEEVKAGFILTCQSHPVTSKIAIDFDVK